MRYLQAVLANCCHAKDPLHLLRTGDVEHIDGVRLAGVEDETHAVDRHSRLLHGISIIDN